MVATEQITSIKDPRVAEARELSSAAGRARVRKILLEGAESIGWALDAGLSVAHVFRAASSGDAALLARLAELRIPCHMVSDGILKKITGTSYLVPLAGVTALPGDDAGATLGAPAGDLVVVLDRVVDHGNIGTIVRAASAFGVRDLISTTADLDLYFKKTVQASRGKVFETRLRRFESGAEAVAHLRGCGYQVVATSSHARAIQALAPLAAKPVALVVGNETAGISHEVLALADVVVQIPMAGRVESLNVGVAAGISLYELKLRLVLAMLVHYIRSNIGREVGATAKLICMAFDAALRKVTDLNSAGHSAHDAGLRSADDARPGGEGYRDLRQRVGGAARAAARAPHYRAPGGRRARGYCADERGRAHGGAALEHHREGGERRAGRIHRRRTGPAPRLPQAHPGELHAPDGGIVRGAAWAMYLLGECTPGFNGKVAVVTGASSGNTGSAQTNDCRWTAH
jgi:TrmH family RNA methyltransferase